MYVSFNFRAQKVCRAWKDVSERPRLWTHVDMGMGVVYGWKYPSTKAAFTRFLKKYLSMCRVLKIANCHSAMARVWGIQVC